MFSKSLVWLATKVCGLSVDPPAKSRCSKNTPHLGQPVWLLQAPRLHFVVALAAAGARMMSTKALVLDSTKVTTAQPGSADGANLTSRPTSAAENPSSSLMPTAVEAGRAIALPEVAPRVKVAAEAFCGTYGPSCP